MTARAIAALVLILAATTSAVVALGFTATWSVTGDPTSLAVALAAGCGALGVAVAAVRLDHTPARHRRPDPEPAALTVADWITGGGR